jgi:hypothetical protein
MTEHTYERRSGQTPSEAVIAAVAEATDQSPLEMIPLAEVIDPDAVDGLITRADGATAVSVAFEYCWRHVTVTPVEVQVDS